jgi:flagellar motor switch protein FliM
MATESGVIRRKLAAARMAAAEGGPGADRGWRLALARAARDLMALSLDISALRLTRASLAELLELPADRSLYAVLEGPGEGMGLLALSPPILQGLIEAQTLGRVQTGPAPARKPTRTDAAMVAGLIDAALTGLEQTLAQEADLIWAGGFRYASFLDDPRPLGLLLDDCSYRVLRAEVALDGGARTGEVLLALPAEGRGSLPAELPAASEAEEVGPAFSQALAGRVEGAAAVLQGVMARLTLPLSAVMTLAPGEVLPLPAAALDRISIEGIDGRRAGEGRLGQNRGMRALRLTAGAEAAAPPVAAVPGVKLPAVPVPAEALRQAG